MFENNDIYDKISTKHLSLDYKLLEWRLMINKELYDEKVIAILGRMTRIMK